MKRQVVLLFFIVLIIASTALAHPGGHGAIAPDELRTWTNCVTGETFTGAYLLTRDGNVQLEDERGNIVAWPLAALSERDQEAAKTKQAQIHRLNQFAAQANIATTTKPPFSLAALVFACCLLSAFLYVRKCGVRFSRVTISLLLLCGLLSWYSWRQQAQINRPAMAAAFDAYNAKVKTRWDEKFLYVESDGLPDHPMMIGIRAWQQQVPLPQPYTGNNAWQIPLKPVLAEQPISAKHALYRGAIALAVNGVPIFNALNNRGEDAYAIGELDEWGGHCGRADDYHYHAAPLHLQQKIGTRQPLAYALDGFPLYGLNEPEGKPARPLDEFNGHADSADMYHYHSTKTYPYINGGMRGVVTVRDDQVDPQPRAAPVREFLQPLRGASITDFKTVEPNHWQLKYQLRGQTHEVNYRLSDDGKAEFTFIDGDGNRTTEQYSRRDRNRRGPPRDDERRPPRRNPNPTSDTQSLSR
ncbi:MAG: YHYH protein [Blastocatellia bacterium]